MSDKPNPGPYDLYFGILEESGRYRPGAYTKTCNVCAITIDSTWTDEKERHIIFHESIRLWAMTEDQLRKEISRRVQQGRLPANNPYRTMEGAQK